MVVYRPTDRQTPLFGAEAGLGDRARRRLRESWAEWFRAEVMPVLLESEGSFSKLYGARGRPNWSVARMLAVCLLQHLENLNDQAALDALSFDARWQYALGVTPEDAYLSRRSLVEFRRRLVACDPDGTLSRAVFDRVCQAGLQQLELSTAHQRLDSTHITSDIRVRGRLSLARETLRVFLRSLEKSSYEQIDAEIRAWHGDDTRDWEGEVTGPEAKASLQKLGVWVRQLVDQFASDEAVRETEPYQLLVRLLREHAEALSQSVEHDEQNDDEPPTASLGNAGNRRKAQRKKRSKKRKKKTGKAGKARYWTPHDPDASFGHKGLGYHVHVAETCRNNSTELLTDYDVVTAADSDVGRALAVIERLAEHDRRADALYADGGYPTPDHLVEARCVGTELYAPVHRGRLSDETFSRTDFAWEDGQLVACPAGHKPSRYGERASSDAASRRRSLHVFFDAEHCTPCALRDRCPVRQPNNQRSREYRLDIADQLMARDQRWIEQQTEPWRAGYRIRAGVEATMSELKRGHGLGRLRVRGMPRVRLQVAFKVIACNVKRWARAARCRAVRSLLLVLMALQAALAATSREIDETAVASV